MKNNLFLSVAVLTLSFTAQALQVSDLLGNYESMAKISGLCSPNIKIVSSNFSEPPGSSMSIYTLDQNDSNHIIFQFSNLNAGRKIQPQENPIRGGYDGWYITEQRLINNTLSGETKATNLFGNTLWLETITAKLSKDSIEYVKTSYNTLSGQVVQTRDQCSYRRIN